MTSSAHTMRAMRASGPDQASLTCETIPVPEPGPGELLVEVQATAVTADELSWPESWPAIPCHDLSGPEARMARIVRTELVTSCPLFAVRSRNNSRPARERGRGLVSQGSARPGAYHAPGTRPGRPPAGSPR